MLDVAVVGAPAAHSAEPSVKVLDTTATITLPVKPTAMLEPAPRAAMVEARA